MDEVPDGGVLKVEHVKDVMTKPLWRRGGQTWLVCRSYIEVRE